MAIHIDVITALERRAVREVTTELDTTFRDKTIQLTPEIKRDKVLTASREIQKIQREFDKLKADVEVKASVTSIGATRAKINAGLGNIRADVKVGIDRNYLNKSLSNFGGDLQNAIASPGRIFSSGPGMALLPVVIAGLTDVVKVAVTASQSLWLLPAALTAAGAGMGTLQLATLGFSDAIQNIGDPEKFATALQSLAPNAQQAALSIQNLMPRFTELKNAAQDALFNNFGEKIFQLSNTYLPQIQTLTTGIANSFNQMATRVADELMTPANQAQLQEIMTNIGQGFDNMVPAAERFAQAFVDITNVGSTFLPELAGAISDVAGDFATFIDNAQKSGKLREWLGDGINAVKEIGREVWNVGKTIYDVFGKDGKKNIEDFRKSMENWLPLLRDVFSLVSDIASAIGKFNDFNQGIHDWIHKQETGVRGAFDALRVFPTDPGLLGPVTGKPPAAGAGPGLWGPVTGKPDKTIPGMNLATNTPTGPAYPGPFPKPAAPGPGGKPSDKDRRDAIKAGLDPNTYRVDPYAPVPGLPPGTAPPLKPNQMPQPGQPGYYQTDPQAILEAQHNVEGAGHDLEEARKDRLALEKDNQASAEEIADAKWKETEAGWKLQKEQANLAQAQRGTYESMSKSANNMSKGMGEIGAALDKDFGISKGLPGIAENLTKFLANLAFAPMLGQLSAVSAASPSQGGYGLIGMLGAQGAFGPMFTGLPGVGTGTGTGTGQSPYGGGIAGMLNARTQGGTGYPGDAALLANVPAGKYTQEQRGDLTAGLADCSSAVEDLVNLLDGRPTAGASMSTGNAAEWLTARGFLPGMGGPGDMRVGYNSGHMQATLPGGTPFNWGGADSAARGGVGGTGAYDPAFTSHYYRPGGMSVMAPGVAAPTAPVAAPSSVPATPARPAAAPSPAPGTSMSNAEFAAYKQSHGGKDPPLPPGTARWSYGPNGTSVALPGYAKGGDVTPALLTPGEHVFTTGDVAAMGGQSNVYAFRRQLRGYQDGGAVDPKYGGVEPYSNPGGGGLGITPGGSIDTALNLAASAFPGIGQAAATGMKLANRAIEYGGQVAGIAASGLMETFLPTGGSELANNNWLTRLGGALAGAAPALPNIAGGPTGTSEQPVGAAASALADLPMTSPPPLTPQQVLGAGASAVADTPSTTINLEYTNNQAPEDRAGVDIMHNISKYAMPGRR